MDSLWASGIVLKKEWKLFGDLVNRKAMKHLSDEVIILTEEVSE